MNLFGRTKPADPSLPSYALLENRLDGSEIDTLLGRIVVDFRNPLDGYRPDDPRKALLQKPMEIIDTEFSSLFSVSKNKTAAGKIGSILNVDFNKLTEEGHRLKSSFVRTRILPQHRDALDALLTNYGPEIIKLMQSKDAKGKAYMAVGLKSCVNGEMGKERKYEKVTKVEIAMPTDTIVTAASHGIINPGPQFNVEAKKGQGNKEEASTSARMRGEQIFAVRYRILTLEKTKNKDKQMTEEHAEYGDVLRVQYENGVFSYTTDEHNDFIFEDDEPENNENPKQSENTDLDSQDLEIFMHPEGLFDSGISEVVLSECEDHMYVSQSGH